MRIDSGISGDMAARLNNTVNQLRPNGPNDRGAEAINMANEEGDSLAISQRARDLAGGESAAVNSVQSVSLTNNIQASVNAAEPRPVERTGLTAQEPPPPPTQREPGPLDVTI